MLVIFHCPVPALLTVDGQFLGAAEEACLRTEEGTHYARLEVCAPLTPPKCFAFDPGAPGGDGGEWLLWPEGAAECFLTPPPSSSPLIRHCFRLSGGAWAAVYDCALTVQDEVGNVAFSHPLPGLTDTECALFGSVLRLHGRMGDRAYLCAADVRDGEVRYEAVCDDLVLSPDGTRAAAVFRRGDTGLALQETVAPDGRVLSGGFLTLTETDDPVQRFLRSALAGEDACMEYLTPELAAGCGASEIRAFFGEADVCCAPRRAAYPPHTFLLGRKTGSVTALAAYGFDLEGGKIGNFYEL